MSAPPIQNVIETLVEAGLSLELTREKRVKVTPSSSLTGELRHLIRANKMQLVAWLAERSVIPAANDAVAPYPTRPLFPRWQPPDPVKSAAYYTHHFSCRNCIAAGRGSSYGDRCAVGMTLWKQMSPCTLT